MKEPHKWWRDPSSGIQKENWIFFESFAAFLLVIWDHLRLPQPTPIQLDIADYLQDNAKKRKIIQAFRGVGKSYVTSAFVLWLLLRDPDLAILVVSASKIRADEFTTFTLRLIEEVPLLRRLKPRPEQRQSKVAFDVGPAKAKHSPSVKSVGIMGQLAGSRGDVIVADDVEVPNNSETQQMREKLSERVKEFDAVLKPGGSVYYLGTPQTEDSLYTGLQSRGYECRIWPARVPDKAFADRLGYRLAPYVQKLMDEGQRPGSTTDPKRFSDDDLLERELSYGRSGFALQFMLDVSLADQDRYPLKLKDLIVHPLDAFKGPRSIAWGPKAENVLNVHTAGMDGDRFHGPAFVDKEYDDYTGSAMFIDPSGKGKDETSIAVSKHLNGMIFITAQKNYSDGYTDETLKSIALTAKDQKVKVIKIEENFGGGMFASLLMPWLAKVSYKCEILEERSVGQKEKRIIETLEPVMNQHRLVIDEKLIEEDHQSVQGYPGDRRAMYQLFYQMTRLTSDRGALAHDDRIESVAGAVAYWVESMALDQAKAAEKAADKAFEKAAKDHFRTLLDFSDKPRRRRKTKLGGGTSFTFGKTG